MCPSYLIILCRAKYDSCYINQGLISGKQNLYATDMLNPLLAFNRKLLETLFAHAKQTRVNEKKEKGILEFNQIIDINKGV